MVSLDVKLGALSLENPTMLASGILAENAGMIRLAALSGAGAVVTKSIGILPREGYPNPTLVDLGFGYINAMGLPNPGIDEFEKELEDAFPSRVPIVGSIYGTNPDEFAFLGTRMEAMGVAALELNLSCPHAKGYGMELGIDADAVYSIVRKVKNSVNIPVFTKLTPNTDRITDIAKTVERAGGDGVVAINTLKAMVISIDFKRPILANLYGGLSGKAIKPIGIRCVYELYENIHIPIIGVGGIENWKDAVEYIMAGATAIQIGSAVGKKGLNVFRQIINGLRRYMKREGYTTISEITGVAHEFS
ncbi:MAG: dihydroorotate dehydrogenase [Methanomassiliicoccales archaeon]